MNNEMKVRQYLWGRNKIASMTPGEIAEIVEALTKIKNAKITTYGDSVILDWVCSVGPKTILQSTIKEIEEVCFTF